ncbi:unnamed protein product, partial [Polarella glacialis]
FKAKHALWSLHFSELPERVLYSSFVVVGVGVGVGVVVVVVVVVAFVIVGLVVSIV